MFDESGLYTCYVCVERSIFIFFAMLSIQKKLRVNFFTNDKFLRKTDKYVGFKYLKLDIYIQITDNHSLFKI